MDITPREKFKSLNVRRATFERGWPNLHVCYDDLSRAGFYYTGKDDQTTCAFCRGTLKNWTARDEPLLEHARHFPACPFILNPPDYAMKDDGVQEIPKNLNMTTFKRRLKSFDVGWLSEIRAERLAPAGFYFIGFSDCAECFQCGLRLNNWAAKDDPFEEHARWDPSCPFISIIWHADFRASVVA
jgi:hypothetical protein